MPEQSRQRQQRRQSAAACSCKGAVSRRSRLGSTKSARPVSARSTNDMFLCMANAPCTLRTSVHKMRWHASMPATVTPTDVSSSAILVSRDVSKLIWLGTSCYALFCAIHSTYWVCSARSQCAGERLGCGSLLVSLIGFCSRGQLSMPYVDVDAIRGYAIYLGNRLAYELELFDSCVGMAGQAFVACACRSSPCHCIAHSCITGQLASSALQPTCSTSSSQSACQLRDSTRQPHLSSHPAAHGCSPLPPSPRRPGPQAAHPRQPGPPQAAR
jgi:hypothetical protein